MATRKSSRAASRIETFLDLVRRINQEPIARSEADLSSSLKEAFEELGLHAVLDTSSGPTRKRPDILLYRHQHDADLVLPADVVVEAKKPSELRGCKSLADAISGLLWEHKTLPYIRANLARIQYFCLTTFTDFAFLRISAELRSRLSEASLPELLKDTELREVVRRSCEFLPLNGLGGIFDRDQSDAWRTWVTRHLTPERLGPLPFSQTRAIVDVSSGSEIEEFADRLADLAAGARSSSNSLFSSIRERLPPSYEAFDAETKRDLHLFVMAQNPAHSISSATSAVRQDTERRIDEFIASSIHSLISRLFAVKAAEDLFCVNHPAPLLPPSAWVLSTDAYDHLADEDLPKTLMARLRSLAQSENEVLKRISLSGAFFDWMERFVDPVLFRTLLELFNSVTLARLEGDLLGRFFEHYSQRINRSQRRALGQYYTPLPVVRFMWTLTANAAKKIARPEEITVLDPGMGSGTFLSEGVRSLARLRVPRFWERLVGFDISPQVMGIAHANLYTSILGQIERHRVQEVTDLRLYTTDALDPGNGKYLEEVQVLFSTPEHRAFLSKSIEVSAQIKASERFCIVIGNPPYKNNSVLPLAQVARRFPRLLGTSATAARAQERNIRDDYAWFFAAADHYLENTRGLVCFITSDSYTNRASYRYFREEMLRNFKILSLIRLGTNLFRDVGPRISFSIILLQRRPRPLSNAEDAEAMAYHDLRPLADDAPQGTLATDQDPRLQLLTDVAAGRKKLPHAKRHQPRRTNQFSFLPDADIAQRVLEGSLPVAAKEGPRLFSHKWPGIITAFDAVLKASSPDELHRRLSALFELAHQRGLSDQQLQSRLERWASDFSIKLPDKLFARLQVVVTQISNLGLEYSRTKIQRSFDGSIPNESRWYPDPHNQCWIYYEPRIHFPRNVNEGKRPGWGTMEQWRAPESHQIAHKLVYTTSKNPDHGYKAYVLSNEWYVKLQGGKSQQYNYTGLSNPANSESFEVEYNNLTPEGQGLLRLFVRAGEEPEALLYYVAGIYNSALAREFIEEEPSSDLRIKLPSPAMARLAVRISRSSRRLSSLFKLIHELPHLGKQVSRDELDALAGPEIVAALEVHPRKAKVRGYSTSWMFDTSQVILEAKEQATEIQDALDQDVNTLYR